MAKSVFSRSDHFDVGYSTVVYSRVDDVDKLRITKKKQVNDLIEKAVTNCVTFARVLSDVEQHCSSTLDRRERAYVETQYVKLCLDKFVNELRNCIQTNSFQFCKDPNEFGNYIRQLRDISELAKCFSTFRYCRVVIECDNLGLICKTDRERFLRDFKSICWHVVVQKIKVIQGESDFIREFKIYLQNCFVSYISLFENSVSLVGNPTDVVGRVLAYFTSITAQQNTEKTVQQLVHLSASLGSVELLSVSFINIVSNLLTNYCQFYFRDAFAENNRLVVIYTGGHIDIYSIESNLNNHQYRSSIDEIRIYANELLFLSKSVDWTGVNVVIVCPTLYINYTHDNIYLNVSGLNVFVQFPSQKAPNGSDYNWNGQPGFPGGTGQSGGNVLLLCDKIVNEGKLTIISNGGNGQNGQDGGDGRDGRKGNKGLELSKEEFNRRFPCTNLLHGAQCRANVKQILDNIYNKTDQCQDKDCLYMTGTTVEGLPVTFGFYCNNWNFLTLEFYPIRQCYLLVKGGIGGKGENGGDGGRGGQGGQGGCCGSILLKGLTTSKSFNVATIYTRGQPGMPGADGTGGRAGMDGQRGGDRAKIDPCINGKTITFYGDCSFRYYDSDPSYQYAWCIRHKKYVGIGETGLADVQVTTAQAGQTGRNTYGQYRSQDAIQKTSIIEENIRYEYNALGMNTANIQNVRIEFSEFQLCQSLAQSDSEHVVHLQMTDQPKRKLRFSGATLHHVAKKAKHAKIKKCGVLENIVLSNPLLIKLKHMCDKANEIEVLVQIYSYVRSQRIDMKLDYKRTKFGSDLTEFAVSIMRRCFTTATGKIQKLIDSVEGIKEQQPDDQSYPLLMLLFEKYKVSHLSEFCDRIEELKDLPKVRHSTNHSYLETAMQHQLDNLIMRLTIDVQQDSYEPRAVDDLGTKVKQVQYAVEKLRQSFIRMQRESTEASTNPVSRTSKSHKTCTPDSLTNKMSLLSLPDTFTSSAQFGTTSSQFDDVSAQFGATLTQFDQASANIGSTTAEGRDQQHLIVAGDTDEEFDRQESDSNSIRRYFESITNSLPHSIKCLLLKLQYVAKHHGKDIANLIAKRIKLEGLQIEFDALKWLIIKTLDEISIYGPAELVLLFGANHKDMWLIGYMLLQIRQKLSMTIDEKIKLKSTLKRFKDVQILLFLSQKLAERSDEDFQLSTIYEILDTSQVMAIDAQIMTHLQEVDLNGWPLRLKWFKSMLDIRDIKIGMDWLNKDIEKATYFVSEITNRYGDERASKLMRALKQKRYIEKGSLMTLLHNIYRTKWVLDDTTLNILSEEQSDTWLRSLGRAFHSHASRSVQDLVQIMRVDNNNSEKIQQGLDDAKYRVQQVISMKSSYSRMVNYKKCISSYSSRDISEWLSHFQFILSGYQPENLVEEHYAEILAVIDQAIKLNKGFYLRNTQLLALVLFIFNKEKALLQQISTGEGKSLIIVALAIIKALQGYNVDILTSSPVLAKRDAEHNRDIFKLFGVKVGHNCSDELPERRKVYVEAQVIYGEIGTFQRDSLLTDFYNKDVGIGSRVRGYVIVDEVDSMLLDKGQNVLYLSHDIPGMDALEPVYVYIWNFVNARGMIGSDDDVAAVEECVRNAMYPSIRKQDLNKLTEQGTEETFTNQLWADLMSNEIIDRTGKILNPVLMMSNSYVFSDFVKLKLGQQQELLSLIKDAIRKGIDIEIPNSLLEFVNLHMREWIENAFKAKYMALNDSYIIDVNRSESVFSRDPNITIMDNDTGVEQYHSQWSHGLHQFLQLKHGCRLSFESLKAVFMSNVTFFRKYGKQLYGLSGTLGSMKERNFLRSMYNTEYATIPTDRLSQFEEDFPKVCETEENWFKEIETSVLSLRLRRPVLIVCQNVSDVEKLERRLNRKQVPLKVYKHSYEQILDETLELDEPCVILSTNLAGRGTDIRISERLNQAGGLHVCLTYLPANVRIEEQAFGRAARKGQHGSGQLIFLTQKDAFDSSVDASHVITQLKVKRNIEEEELIDKIKRHFEQIVEPEEKQFAKFQTVYQRLERFLEQNEFDKVVKNIILRNCLDDWAFWIDEAGSKYRSGDSDINQLEAVIDDVISGKKCIKLVTRSAHRLQLAKHYADKRQYITATEQLKQIIQDDSYFGDIAHYYLCHAIIKSTHIRSQEDKEKLYEHLGLAQSGLRHKSDLQASYASVVTVVAEQYKKNRLSFLLSDDYKKQKQDTIEIYNVFLYSLQEITGTEFSLDMFLNLSPLNIKHAVKLYENVDYKIADAARIINLPKINSLRNKYHLYFTELKMALSRRNDLSIEATHLKDVLPSREEFWEVLRTSRMLSNEQDYVMINMTALETQFPDQQDPVVFKLREGLKDCYTCEEFISFLEQCSKQHAQRLRDIDSRNMHSSKTVICVNPVQIGDIEKQPTGAGEKSGNTKVLSLLQFERKFGKLNEWKALQHKNILVTNTTATLSYSKTVKLGKYDALPRSAFEEIEGMTERMAANIWTELVSIGLISYTGYLTSNVNSKDIKLSICRHFETEVLNRVCKHFRYRTALTELLSSGEITLESNPHEDLFNDLVAQNVISPQIVRASCSQDQLANEIRKILQNTKSTFSIDENTLNMISEQLYESKSGLAKFGDVDSSLREITVYFNEETRFNCHYELHVFESNGFSDVITLLETRWSRYAVAKMVAIFLIGLTQVAVGLAIEVYTLGIGSIFAAGLINEGIGDMFFAVDCALAGYCTWQSYKQYKMQSVCMSMLCVGAGAYFARGAKFSRFGDRIGGAHLKQLCGEALIKEVGESRLINEVVATGGQLLLDQGIGFAQNYAVNLTIELMIKNLLQGLTDQVMASTDFSQLDNALQTLVQQVGLDAAMRATDRITQRTFESCSVYSQFIAKITSMTSQLGHIVSYGMQTAAERVNNGSSYSNIANKINTIMKYITKTKSIADLVLTINQFSSCLLKEIEQEIARNRNRASAYSSPYVQTDPGEITRFRSSTLEQWKLYISQILSSKIEDVVVQPVLQNITGSFVDFVSEQYSERVTRKQQEKFDKLRDKQRETVQALEAEGGEQHADQASYSITEVVTDHYHRQLTKLLEQTRDPALFAEIIKEGVPIGVHACQAVAESLSRPIVIVQRDGSAVSPTVFEPSECDSITPIVLEYCPGIRGKAGYFTTIQTNNENSSLMDAGNRNIVRNKCLLDAISATGHVISREKLAETIMDNVNISYDIVRGVHEHYIHKGRLPYCGRAQARDTDKDKTARGVEYDEINIGVEVRKRYRSRESAGETIHNSDGRDWRYVLGLKTWSNHAMDELSRTTGSVQYDHLDVFERCRVDIRYILLTDNDGKLSGHPGTLFRVVTDESTAKDKVTSRFQRYRHHLYEFVSQKQTASETAVAAVVAHLNQTIDPDELQRMTFDSDVYTTTNHNLKTPEQRDAFVIGYKRERYKMFLIARQCNGGEIPRGLQRVPQPLPFDEYSKNIESEITQIRSTDISSLGSVMMTPAPCPKYTTNTYRYQSR